MSEVKSGKIFRKNTQKGDKRGFISFTTRKGKEDGRYLSEEEASALAALLVDASEENPVEVEFEFVKTKIDRIRPAGKSYSVPQGTSFHNPYNFVPLSRNPPSRQHGLGQFDPPGHQTYRDDLYEGRINVELTAASPLLLLDPATASVANDHKTIDLLKDSNHNPILRPTSLKGALRSAYEAITCSRFAVFHGHDRPLARRMDARDSLAMMPARISSTNGLELYLGQHNAYPTWNGRRWDVPKNEMYAAWLPRYTRPPTTWEGYNNRAGPVIHSSVRYTNSSSPNVNDRVVCWLNLVQCTRPRMEYWEVMWLQPEGESGRIPDEASFHGSARRAGPTLPGGHSRTRTYRLVTGEVRLAAGILYVNVSNPNGPVIDRKAVRYPNGSLSQHGDPVVCWLNRVQKNNGNFSYWRVVWIQSSSSTSPPVSRSIAKRLSTQWSRTNHTPTSDFLLAEGYVCVTNQNFGRKHDERVFFVQKGKNPIKPKKLCMDQWRGNWTCLVEDYQAVHEADLGARKRSNQAADAYLGRDPGRTAWSRHVHHGPAGVLNADDLCYARVDKNGDIVGLYPVMISRELAKKIPRELLPAHLLPAEDISDLSAADRVFGWVRQGKDDAVDVDAKNAYKGHLRIRRIVCETEACDAIQEFNGNGLPLAILSTPKPQQALFYADGALSYDQAVRLSGRKFYPHHRGVPKFYWSADDAKREADSGDGQPEELSGGFSREYIRRQLSGGNTAKQRDRQNQSIRAWVNPGTTFTAEIRFDNLNGAELGALLWLCSLGKSPEPDEKRHVRYLKVGAGKPLGFGSITTKILKVEIRGHGAKRKEYETLVTESDDNQKPHTIGQGAMPTSSGKTNDLITCPEIALKKFSAAFETALGQKPGQLEKHPAVAAFVRMAEGPEDGAPVHYPRIRRNDGPGPVPPDPKGENYRWFVENQRTEHQCPLPAPGEKGLPYHSPESNSS